MYLRKNVISNSVHSGNDVLNDDNDDEIIRNDEINLPLQSLERD